MVVVVLDDAHKFLNLPTQTHWRTDGESRGRT